MIITPLVLDLILISSLLIWPVIPVSTSRLFVHDILCKIIIRGALPSGDIRDWYNHLPGSFCDQISAYSDPDDTVEAEVFGFMCLSAS